MSKFKVFIANDDLKIIDNVNSIFFDSNKFEVIGTSQDGMEAYQKIMELEPDLAFVGDKMKNLNGPEIMEKVNPFLLHAKTTFVLISDHKIFLQYDFLIKYMNIDILYNPIERRELLNARDKFLKRKERLENYPPSKAFIQNQLLNREYTYIRHIDYSKYINENDVELLHKLDIDIDLSKKYTEEEHELIEGVLVYFWDGGSDIYGNKLPPDRKIELTGVSRKEYNRLYDIIYSVETMYT